MTRVVEVHYLDGAGPEVYVLPDGVEPLRESGDLLRLGNVEIERRTIRRTVMHERED